MAQFGFSNINKPTPASLNLWVRVITVIIATFIAWMNTSDLISDNGQHIINGVSGLVVSLLNGVAPLFGVDIETKTVPKEDVASIVTHKE